MGFKEVLGKIATAIWNFIKAVAKKIWGFIKWVGRRLKRWGSRTKAKVSRVYLVYACLMSGIIGFGKSVKAQYRVWKSERKEYLHPEPAELGEV